ncbi:MAG: hypothetical protein HWE25_06645 [Alphaproteobacteria bacterium]|nr:hypothetical protein [Alphaproteobacteria bacterium]
MTDIETLARQQARFFLWFGLGLFLMLAGMLGVDLIRAYGGQGSIFTPVAVLSSLLGVLAVFVAVWRNRAFFRVRDHQPGAISALEDERALALRAAAFKTGYVVATAGVFACVLVARFTEWPLGYWVQAGFILAATVPAIRFGMLLRADEDAADEAGQ